MHARTCLAVVAATALLVAGCGEGGGSGGSGGSEAAAPTANSSPDPARGGIGGDGRPHTDGSDQQSPPAEIPEALDFEAEQVSGEAFDARVLAGQDTVFWFWAPWCTECAAQADDVVASAETNPDVAFVGVAGLSSDAASMQTFVDQHGLAGFPQLADTDGELYTRFSVAQQQTFVFVGADGATETLAGYGSSVDVDAALADAFG